LRIRSIANLYAFEAAARHRSFTQAAQELNVTQGAISHRIKQLERELGVALFERYPHKVELTPAGDTFLPAVSDALSRLQQATLELAPKGEKGARRLTVLAMQAFATLWLVPRLEGFRKRHPRIEICLVSWLGGQDYISAADFRQYGIDVGILYTDKASDLPGLQTDLLGNDLAVPVCSPGLLKSVTPLTSPDDLRHQTMIHALSWPGIWERWLAAVAAPHVQAVHNVTFQNSLLTLQGALSGIGVAMAHKMLAMDYIRSGQLVTPFAFELQVDQAYYCVSRERSGGTGTVTAFKNWVRSEFKALAPH
jgi:LysR family transcriptional regulator, glycine cleavage system transcriptional activator